MNQNGNNLILAVDLKVRFRGRAQRLIFLRIVKWLLALIILGLQIYRALHSGAGP